MYRTPIRVAALETYSRVYVTATARTRSSCTSDRVRYGAFCSVCTSARLAAASLYFNSGNVGAVLDKCWTQSSRLRLQAALQKTPKE